MPNLDNVISDVRDVLFQNNQYEFEVLHEQGDIWIVYMRKNGQQNGAKLEFIIEEVQDDEPNVFGSILDYGPISKRIVHQVMDATIERM